MATNMATKALKKVEGLEGVKLDKEIDRILLPEIMMREHRILIGKDEHEKELYKGEIKLFLDANLRTFLENPLVYNTVKNYDMQQHFNELKKISEVDYPYDVNTSVFINDVILKYGDMYSSLFTTKYNVMDN